MKRWQKSCHRFWLLTQSVASLKKRNWIWNLNGCCECGGCSHGSTTKEATERQKRVCSFWNISTQDLQTYRQQHQHLKRCLVICWYKHAPCTNIGCILVMSPRITCRHLPLKSIKGWRWKYRQRPGSCFLILQEILLDKCVSWNRFLNHTSAPLAWWLDITQKLSQFGWKPMPTPVKEFWESTLANSWLVWQMGWLVKSRCMRSYFCIAGDLAKLLRLNSSATTGWLFDNSWSWGLHQQVDHWSSHHTWRIETVSGISDCSRAQHVARCAWHSVLEGSENVSSVCRWCELAVQCYSSHRGARSSGHHHVRPRQASQCCTVPSFFTLSMRLRGSSWFLCMGRCERSSSTRWFSDRRLRDNSGHRKMFRTFPRRLLDRTTVRVKLLRLLTSLSGWHCLLGQRCTVLRCGAGTWTKLFGRWVECSLQILEVSSIPWREANHRSFDCEGLTQMKKRVEWRNNAFSSKRVLTGSTLWRCWQAVWPNLDATLALWWNRSRSRHDGDAPIVLRSGLTNAGNQDVHFRSTTKTLTTSTHRQIRSRSTLCCGIDRFLRMFVRSCVRNTNDIDVCLPDFDFWQLTNTPRVVYLTKVPTLENSALILFFSIFGRDLVFTSGFGATNVARGWQFCWRTSISSEDSHVFNDKPVIPIVVCFLTNPAETVVSLVISLFWLKALDSGELSVGTTQSRLARPSGSVDTHQSRSAGQVLCCTVSVILFVFLFLPLKGGYFALL